MEEHSFLTKINNFLIYLFAFSISFFVKALPTIIVILVVSLTIQTIISGKIHLRLNLAQIIIIGLYLFYVIGFLWSTDREAALFALEVKLSLIVFPIIIAVNSDFFLRNTHKILRFFVLGIIFSSLLCLLTAIWESTYFLPTGISFDTIDPEYANWAYGGSHFRYLNLSLFLHPTYFSFYILFALAITILFLKKGMVSNKYLVFCLKAALPLFILMIYLLSSKAVLFSALLLLIVFAIRANRAHNNKLKKILISIIVFVLVIITVQNPRFSTIRKAIKNPELLNDNSKDGSFVSRLHIWNAGADIIKNNIFIGVGPGDSRNELAKRYKYYNYIDPLLLKSNAHNQYIETFIDIGLFGFLLLLSVFIIPIYKSIKKRDVLFLVFLFIMGFNFLFESILNTQAGVVFFAFFYSLLALTNENETNEFSI